MKFKKTLILLLCLAVLATMFVGCKDNDDDDNGSNGDDGEHVHGFDIDAAMATFPPDTVMMRVGDLTVTWAELYFFLHSAAAELSYGFMVEIDWDEEYIIDSLLSEVVLNFSADEAIKLLVYEYAANVLGVELSQDDLDIIQTDIDSWRESAGGEAEFLVELNGNGFFNLDVFKAFNRREFYPRLLLAKLYGDDFTDIADSSVADFVEQYSFMRAQHILLAFLREEDGYSLQEIDEHKTELRIQADNLLALLNEHADDDDFLDYFSILMWEHGEDPGMLNNPDGYLFQPSDMVAPFSEACAQLEYGQFSGIVVTSYGYHIILRLPVDYDDYPLGYNYTLRLLAVMEEFGNMLQQWHDEMEVEYTPEFDSINLAEIFKASIS